MYFCIKKILKHYLNRGRFPSSVIHLGATVDKSSLLGKSVVLFSDAKIINSCLGAYTYVQSGSVILNAEVGKFCSIASNVSIGLANHPINMVSTSPVFYDNTQPLPNFFVRDRNFIEQIPKTIVESDVWIGQGVMIKAGVKIGVGSIIGAGSIVTKDVPPYVVAAGNPCKILRPRFSRHISERLIRSEWWNKSDDELKSLSHLFVDPAMILDELKC